MSAERPSFFDRLIPPYFKAKTANEGAANYMALPADLRYALTQGTPEEFDNALIKIHDQERRQKRHLLTRAFWEYVDDVRACHNAFKDK